MKKYLTIYLLFPSEEDSLKSLNCIYVGYTSFDVTSKLFYAPYKFGYMLYHTFNIEDTDEGRDYLTYVQRYFVKQLTPKNNSNSKGYTNNIPTFDASLDSIEWSVQLPFVRNTRVDKVKEAPKVSTTGLDLVRLGNTQDEVKLVCFTKEEYKVLKQLIYGNNKTNLEVNIDETLLEKVSHKAKEMGFTLDYVVSRAIDYYLNNNQEVHNE